MHLDHIATDNEQEFILASADIMQSILESALAEDGEAILGLSGGSTPKPIYEELGNRELEWENIKLFLVDDRYIAADSSDSNQKLVRETLLAHAQIPESNVVFPDTSLPIEACIAQYATDLQKLWSNKLPDLLTLGLGEDGHIASLFPPVGADALGDEHLVLHTTTDQFAVHDRMTVSLNAIAAAQNHLLLLKGEGKKAVWDEMQHSNDDVSRWPMKRVLETGAVTLVTYW